MTPGCACHLPLLEGFCPSELGCEMLVWNDDGWHAHGLLHVGHSGETKVARVVHDPL